MIEKLQRLEAAKSRAVSLYREREEIEHLKALTQKMREIDALLDEYEAQEDPLKFREEIIQQILTHYPGQKEEYLHLERERALAAEREQEALSMKQRLAPLAYHLDQIAAIRERKGFLRYIFGPRPNATIALHTHLFKEELAKNPELKDIKIEDAKQKIDAYDQYLTVQHINQRKLREELENRINKWMQEVNTR